MGRFLYTDRWGVLGKYFCPNGHKIYRKTRWLRSRRFFILHLSNSTIDKRHVRPKSVNCQTTYSLKFRHFNSDIIMYHNNTLSSYTTYPVELHDIPCRVTRHTLSSYTTYPVELHDTNKKVLTDMNQNKTNQTRPNNNRGAPLTVTP